MVQDRNINETLRDAEFKDESPLKTVARIKGILKEYGIETEEVWGESGVPYCYSIRLTVSGTTFGTNGKGLTKEFALASAYGEMMERLQLGYVGSTDSQKNGDYSAEDSRDVSVPAADLLLRNGKWYASFCEMLYKYTGQQMTPEQILMQFADADGNVKAAPCYNLTTGQTDHFPMKLGNSIYSTNGCAAGNTMEEAIVQAVGEIVERRYKTKILTEQIAVPDVPEEALKKYVVVWDIITYVRSRGFRVHVKDCSLGTKFPVVCVCFIDEKSGRYHTHFGANPVFEIALERALTESFQGRSIDKLAKFDDFYYKKEDVSSIASITGEFAVGVSEKLPDFFVGEPDYEWNENVGFAGRNNRELLREIVAFFAEQGYDILVRDSSHLGFPTCRVLIPGYSEIFAHRISRKLDDFRYITYAIKTLRDPSAAGLEDRMGLLMHIGQMQNLAKGTPNVLGFTSSAKLYTRLSREEDDYLMSAALAYVYYSLGKYAQAVKYINRMIGRCSGADEEYLICLKRCLSLRLNGYDEAQVKKTLAYFHRPETVAALYACMESGSNPMERFTLHCDMTCGEDCLLYHKCGQKRMSELIGLIRHKAEELRYEPFAENLRELTRK